MNKRCNERVENVDFEKLRKCLKNHGIKQSELSIVCGYNRSYVSKHVLRDHSLNKHVSNVLTNAYKIDPSEYMNTQLKGVTNTADEMVDGKLLKRLALKSIEENISVQDFVFKCIIEGLGDKISEEKK
jgi:hypothetical protein